MAYAQDIKHANEYDHVIVNDNVEKCFKEITIHIYITIIGI